VGFWHGGVSPTPVLGPEARGGKRGSATHILAREKVARGKDYRGGDQRLKRVRCR
jgi:hypothetical protein